MLLVLVRHAEAEPGEPDELRPLTAAGRAQARQLGQLLRADGIRPDAVVSSPLLRARQTAAAVARELGAEPSADDRLAPGATAADVLDAIRGRGACVIVVGHQPDCGLIAAELSDGREFAFAPAGFAAIDVPDP